MTLKLLLEYRPNMSDAVRCNGEENKNSCVQRTSVLWDVAEQLLQQTLIRSYLTTDAPSPHSRQGAYCRNQPLDQSSKL